MVLSRNQKLVLGCLAVALLARLPLLLFSYGASFDLESYGLVARHLLSGGSLYGDAALAGRYPYPPLPALMFTALFALGQAAGLPEHVVFKLPALLGDICLVLLAGRLAARLGRTEWRVALACALNPVIILISAGHGQFDSLVLAFVLAAVYLLEFSSQPWAERAAGLSLGLAVALKGWPLFLLPFFVGRLPDVRERIKFSLAAVAPLALVCLPWLPFQGGAMLRTVLGYHGARALSLPEVTAATTSRATGLS